MSWDLSSEEAITDKLESQQRTIEIFSGKIKKLELELASTKKMLDEAVKVAKFYADMQVQAAYEGPVTLVNFNKATLFMYDYEQFLAKHEKKEGV